MSIIVQRFPQCDICFESNADFITGISTTKQLRLAMFNGGWIHQKGKDICPDCQVGTSKKKYTIEQLEKMVDIHSILPNGRIIKKESE